MSLTIGKHGQNDRLASRLIGWELDIRTKTTVAIEAAKEVEPVSVKEAAGKKKKKEEVSLEQLPGVGEKTLENLAAAGIKTMQDILKAKPEDLTKIKGIGAKKAERLIQEARKLTK